MTPSPEAPRYSECQALGCGDADLADLDQNTGLCRGCLRVWSALTLLGWRGDALMVVGEDGIEWQVADYQEDSCYVYDAEGNDIMSWMDVTRGKAYDYAINYLRRFGVKRAPAMLLRKKWGYLSAAEQDSLPLGTMMEHDESPRLTLDIVDGDRRWLDANNLGYMPSRDYWICDIPGVKDV